MERVKNIGVPWFPYMPWGNQSDKEVYCISRTTRYRQFVSQIIYMKSFQCNTGNLYRWYYETFSVQYRLTSSLAWKIIFFNGIHNWIVPALSILSKKRCTSAYFYLGKNHNKLIYGCNGGKKKKKKGNQLSHAIQFLPPFWLLLSKYMNIWFLGRLWSTSASSPMILILD